MPLIGAGGAPRGRRQKLGAHVGGRNVVARRQAGLEQEHRARRIGDGLAGIDDAHAPRRRPHVDAVIRVARVTEGLLVLLEPVIDLVGREGEIILDRFEPGGRPLVRPQRVLDAPVAGGERPVCRGAARRSGALVPALLDEVGAQIGARKIPDRPAAALEQERGPDRYRRSSCR